MGSHTPVVVAQVERDAFEELVLGSGRMTDVVHKCVAPLCTRA